MTLRSSFLLLLLLSCLSLPSLSQKPFDDRMGSLASMAKGGGIIRITSSSQYNKFVSDADRPYDIIALFTATKPQYKCAPCVAIADEFRHFGASYEAHFGDYLKNKQFMDHPFFLIQLEPDSCMEVFQAYQFTTVPHFVHIPAGNKKVTKPREDQFLRNPQTTVHDMISFAQKHTGIEIPVFHTFMERITPLLTVVAIVALIVKVGQKFRAHLYSPMLWYVLALVTYGIVMAGVVYNRIRNPPFMDVQNGRIQLISPSPRTQFVAEGMVIAVVLGGAGVLFVVLGDFVPRLSGSKKRIAFWISAVLLFMFLTTLNNIYRMKYGSAAFRLNWRLF